MGLYNEKKEREGKIMLRKCTKKDHEQLLEFLLEEKAINLFIIGDLENFGYHADFQDVYAQYDQKGNMEGVLLRYQNTYIPYAKNDIDISDMVKVIKEDPDFLMISGKSEMISRFQSYFSFKRIKETYFAELKGGGNIKEDKHEQIIKKATLNDVDKIIELKQKINEFYFTSSSIKSYKRTLETNTGRSFYVENKQGQVISVASTTAENSYSGMVVGVCTHPSVRQKGLASIVMTELCKELLSEQKTLCLFYDNPKAGRIYKRLGFEDIGMWKMAYNK